VLIFKKKYFLLTSLPRGIFQYPNFPFPQNPLFQYSDIPIVPARHRSRSGEAGGSEAN
jgi:hypothetical protein